MADITMCAGAEFMALGKNGDMVAVICHRRDNCYRYTAKANAWRQSYFMNIPVNVRYNEAGEQTQQCDELMIDWSAMTKEATK